MRKWILALAGVAALTACGVDGEPVLPSLNANVGLSNNGVHAGGSVGLSKGPVNVSLGF